MILAYTPIDRPIPEYSKADLLQFFEEHCGQHKDHSSEQKSPLDQVMNLWDIVTIRGSQWATDLGHPTSWYKYRNDDDSWRWLLDFEKKFPSLIRAVDGFPFRKLTYVALFRNRAPIPLHQDRVHVPNPQGQMVGHLSLPRTSLEEKQFFAQATQTYRKQVEQQDPCSYRMILYGNGHENFLVSPSLSKEQAQACSLPEETNSFVFHTSKAYHGARANTSGKILMYLSGFLDVDAHNQLIEKSQKRFSQHSIYFDENSFRKNFERVPLATQ